METRENEKKLKWVESIAYLMDNQFRLPGTNLRFGLDPIIGLVPFLGDISTFAVSAALVMTMARHGASKNVVIRMVFNIILDLAIGSVPFLGSIFDFAYKANERNVNLLRRHYKEGKYQGSGLGFLLTVLFVLLLSLALVAFGMIKMVIWLFHQAQIWL